jgi:DNA-binding ferritin-like protein
MSADNIHFFISMREQIKIYHWQTKLYSRHKATDEVIKQLDENIDKYVEVYMGKFGRAKLTSRNNTIKLQNLSETSIVKFVRQCIQHLKTGLVKGLSPEDTDLVNIRDEILSDLDQLLYLFTLQ